MQYLLLDFCALFLEVNRALSLVFTNVIMQKNYNSITFTPFPWILALFAAIQYLFQKCSEPFFPIS